ncbi:MAG TPA: hypothetical protein VK907_01845, partial [Phnomibacter sp.]|nr:hypothetical protein [Phnomibacter sp.]
PPLLFFIILSFTNPFQIGIRHAIPVWPFLYIAIVPAFTLALKKGKWILLLLFAIQFADIAWQWPNLMAYTPIWMQPKRSIYERMNDSSIDYCTDGKIYGHFLRTHPQYEPPSPNPKAGLFAVRLRQCNPGVQEGNRPECWITQHFKPIGHYKTSILLYRITREQIASLGHKR